MAVTRNSICKKGMESLFRGGAVIYYASVFLYFWVFSTPVVSLVFGSYLYICINWLHLHFDEAFSSLRIANYKSFTRFHIKDDGDLEVFTIAVDKVRNHCRVPLWFHFMEVEKSNHFKFIFRRFCPYCLSMKVHSSLNKISFRMYEIALSFPWRKPELGCTANSGTEGFFYVGFFGILSLGIITLPCFNILCGAYENDLSVLWTSVLMF